MLLAGSLATPLVVKNKAVSATRTLRQRFSLARPKMLAVFPSGWLRPVAEPWMAGLFGTPFDPTLTDFCGEMPESWWAAMKEILPERDDTRPILDVRALLDARD